MWTTSSDAIDVRKAAVNARDPIGVAGQLRAKYCTGTPSNCAAPVTVAGSAPAPSASVVNTRTSTPPAHSALHSP